ncbi:GNAT family N-acetyltransferase [Sulfitobacter aestuariivivens]|uniref:L-ornithine N(alpha)-acyltransferase n=1 Tax=Sulfitobacter aestuariivivens TaxID=2766981 RepID=A0A927D5L3_9RHOB|nr:GNAT family N-acyltransferase [Sulfitobacter aestuariivivens]MBD3663241.1 GNAT family N-acetyltransferase [Sulfitobacter aestuariivivens]
MAQGTTIGFETRLARTQEEMRAAQCLRYEVFVEELGGSGPLVDHANRLERDQFDPHCDHLMLIDTQTDAVVGVYRLMRREMAQRAGGFYSAAEYDLGPLLTSGRRLLELGRSCVHPDYRGGVAMHHLWTALGRYVTDHKIDILFGVASFHGTDFAALAQPLSLLHHRHLAPPELRVRALEKSFQAMGLVAPDDLDRKAAMVQMPSLIKAYLRLGGCVGEGAFVDHAFNTVDVCLIMDTALLSARQRRIYTVQGS